MKRNLIAPALLALSLAACDVRIGNITPAAQSNIVASENDVLQQIQIGSTTVEQFKKAYPDALQGDSGYLTYGNRSISVESGDIAIYMRDIKGNVPQQMFMFDNDSKVLQSILFSRTDLNFDALLGSLKTAGFAPYPDLTADEFAILQTAASETPESRKQGMQQAGIQQFKKGTLLALAIPAQANTGNKIPTLIIINLAYAPEHHAKWEKHQSSASSAK